MAPPVGVVHATSPSEGTLGDNTNHHNRPRGALHQNQQKQQQELLRLPRTGGDRRQHNNNNRVDVNANRKKIRRQGSLKTIQEENMPVSPPIASSATVLDDRQQQLQQRQPLKGTSRGLQLRRSTLQQQQQQQQQQQNQSNSIGIPQPPPPPPPPPPLHIDSVQHTISAFIPDDAIPLFLPASSSGEVENGYHGDHDDDFPQRPHHHQAGLPPQHFSSSSSSALYNDSARVGYDNLVRVLNFHPEYLEIFVKCHLHLLTGDGPLPFTHRAYIGIMAVSRVRCSPLAQTLSRDFLNLGGDPTWLEGLHRAPNKLRKLSVVNKILAHRPWLVRKSHVGELTKNFEQEQWSASELVHALTLLTHFHALSTFVFACGLQRDDDAAAAAAAATGSSAGSSPPSSPGSPTAGAAANGGSPMESSWMMDSVVERMQRRFNNQSREELTQEECVKRFFTVGSQTAELPVFRRPLAIAGNVATSPKLSSQPLTTDEKTMTTTMTSPDMHLQRFVEDPDFGYDSTLFDAKNHTPCSNASNNPHHLLNDEENEHSLCVQDYSWQEHGFSVLNRFYDSNGSNLLDDKLSVAENLTYRTMATHSGVDTFVFRRAIWNYIDVIFGIRHDDYDYKDIDELLPRTMKKFIKAAVCFPDKLVKKDYRESMRELKQSEKVHVNILMMEARFQGEMLYALRAVTQHLL